MGPTRKRPAWRSRIAEKTLGPSIRGSDSHSTFPPGATSAQTSQSDSRPYSAIGGNGLPPSGIARSGVSRSRPFPVGSSSSTRRLYPKRSARSATRGRAGDGARTGSGVQHDLDRAVLLALEHLVAAGGVVERHVVGGEALRPERVAVEQQRHDVVDPAPDVGLAH